MHNDMNLTRSRMTIFSLMYKSQNIVKVEYVTSVKSQNVSTKKNGGSMYFL